MERERERKRVTLSSFDGASQRDSSERGTPASRREDTPTGGCGGTVRRRWRAQSRCRLRRCRRWFLIRSPTGKRRSSKPPKIDRQRAPKYCGTRPFTIALPALSTIDIDRVFCFSSTSSSFYVSLERETLSWFVFFFWVHLTFALRSKESFAVETPHGDVKVLDSKTAELIFAWPRRRCDFSSFTHSTQKNPQRIGWFRIKALFFSFLFSFNGRLSSAICETAVAGIETRAGWFDASRIRPRVFFFLSLGFSFSSCRTNFGSIGALATIHFLEYCGNGGNPALALRPKWLR